MLVSRGRTRRNWSAGRAAAAAGLDSLSGPLRPRWTGVRSVRPSRGRRFVKTCRREHGGFLRTRSPGRCSKTANRRRTSTGAATSGWVPDPAWCWHSFAGRKPSVGSSALPAGGHLVHGKLPGDSSSESHRGVDARESAEARACCVRFPRPERTTDGRRSGRRAARALGRARLAREGRQASPSNRLRTAQAVVGRSLSTLASLSGGVCQLPLGAPWARGKTFRIPARSRHALNWRTAYRCPTGAKPRRGG